MKKKTTPGLKIISINRKASFNYFFESLYEAGIMLKGSEIKSIRLGKINISCLLYTSPSPRDKRQWRMPCWG